MARDTGSIFAAGAVLVPDFVTPAEEARLLLRIAEAPWLPELSRRVQHYGFRYDYRGTSRPVPAAPFPRWAACMAERLRPHFGGALPVQCIVNEYRPGQGIGMHADHRDFGGIVASLSLGAEWPMRFRPRAARVPTPPAPCPATRSRCSRAARCWCSRAPRATASCTASTDRQRARDRDPRLRDLPHPGGVAGEDEPRAPRG